MSEVALAPVTEGRSAPQLAPLLQLKGISKRWPKVPAPVLADVSLAVEPGSMAFIGGANGVGKTTLLRVAAGLIAPDDGEIRVDGLHPVRDRRAYQSRVGFLPAGTSGLYARLTVAAHLRLWSRLALLPRGQREGAIEATAARFGLEPLLSRRVDRISMGQRQRVRLAMSFLHEPALVLLDEPLTSLDDAGAELLAGALAELGARGGAALWCAPDPAGASFDRSYWLEHGELTPA